MFVGVPGVEENHPFSTLDVSFDSVVYFDPVGAGYGDIAFTNFEEALALRCIGHRLSPLQREAYCVLEDLGMHPPATLMAASIADIGTDRIEGVAGQPEFGADGRLAPAGERVHGVRVPDNRERLP